MKIVQTKKELEMHLKQQLDFLKSSANAYDSGSINEAKRMATVIRILLHDTQNSHSLLGQLGLKKIKFYDTNLELNPLEKRIGGYAGLINRFMSTNTSKVEVFPFLDEPITPVRYVEFDEYWNEKVFIDNLNNSFSRKSIVLFVANQDGGAHVAPQLDKDYALLTLKNSLGWVKKENYNWKSMPLPPSWIICFHDLNHESRSQVMIKQSIYSKKAKTTGLPVDEVTSIAARSAYKAEKRTTASAVVIYKTGKLPADINMTNGFYEKAGFIRMEQIKTLYGDKNAPKTSLEIAYMLFLSDKGRRERKDFETKPIYFGENTW